jgi:hypothetical protein
MLKSESEDEIIEEKFLEKKRGFTNSLSIHNNKKDFISLKGTKAQNKMQSQKEKVKSQNKRQIGNKLVKDNVIPQQDNLHQQQIRNKKLKNKQQIKQPKQICQFYLNGACHKGKECTYSHDVTLIKKKVDLCKYFLTGNCFKGNECVFSHNTKDFPCKFFHAVGYCDKGEACK